MRLGTPHSSLVAVVVGGGTVVACALPLFLTGTLAVQLTEELAFGTAGLGLAVGTYRGMGALATLPLGRVADRLGAIWSVRLAVGVAAVASLGIAVTATSWWTLVAWLMVGGCALALGEPAANRMLVTIVRPGKLGTAFGIKQAAAPAAAMLAGGSVPLVAVTAGWRYAYVLAALAAVPVVVTAGRRPRAAQRPRAAHRAGGLRTNRGVMIMFAAAFGVAVAAGVTVATFYVHAAVRAGTAPQLAGTLLAVASVASIASRIVLGRVADRMPGGHLHLCAGGVAIGSVGIVALASGRPAAMAVGVVVALAGTWGINGVFWFAMMRAELGGPGAVTGVLALGGLAGGTVGPLVFGLVAEGASFPVAWMVTAGIALLGAAGLGLGARRLGRLGPSVPGLATAAPPPA